MGMGGVNGGLASNKVEDNQINSTKPSNNTATNTTTEVDECEDPKTGNGNSTPETPNG